MRFLVAILILLATLAHAQDVEIFIPTPGAGGMQSNYNRLHTLGIDQLLYNLNGVSDKGVLARRKGIGSFGATCAFGLWGATGTHNKEYGWKNIIGVIAPDTLYQGVGQFIYGDTFATFDSGFATSDEVYPDDSAIHDWTVITVIGDATIHADGEQIPFIYTAVSGQKRQQSSPDEKVYGPRLVSMGLEAPGQPRVFQYDSAGGHLSGNYVYGFAFDSGVGTASAPITLDGGFAALSNFPSTAAISDIDWVYIMRKKLDGLNQWYRVDSIYRPEGTHVDSLMPELWLDTFPEQYDTTWWWSPGDSSVASCTHDSAYDCEILYFSTEWFGSGGGWGTLITNSPPSGTVDSILSWASFWRNDSDFTYTEVETELGCGSFRLVNPWLSSGSSCYWDGDSVHAAPGGNFDSVVVDTNTATPYNLTGGTVPGAPVNPTTGDSLNALCRVAYSLYDPIIGIESPLGPSTACEYNRTTDSIFDTLLAYDNARKTGPRWQRFYQTVDEDTNVWYGLFEVRAGDIMARTDTVILTWVDSQVINGLDTAEVDGTGDYPYHFFRFAGIYPQTRPPWIFDCQIRFSDIEYMNGRLWGIGDKLYPYRMYYSAVHSQFGGGYSWNLFDYIDVGTEEIVAIEPALGFGADALYIFQRNAINLLVGADPIYNPFPQVIRSGIGPVSKSAIVRHGNTIFFLSAEDDMGIYVLEGTELLDISDGVRDYIDSIFVGYNQAVDSVRAYKLGDAVKWVNIASGEIWSFDTRSGLPSIERYGDGGAYRPYGSFEHDTVRAGGHSPSMTVDILFTADSAAPLQRQTVGDTVTDHGQKRFPWGQELGKFGLAGRVSMIRKVQLTLKIENASRLWVKILNELDTLACDSFALPSATTKWTKLNSGNFTFDPPIHQGKELSLFFYTIPNELCCGAEPTPMYHEFEILDIRLTLTDKGEYRVR